MFYKNKFRHTETFLLIAGALLFILMNEQKLTEKTEDIRKIRPTLEKK